MAFGTETDRLLSKLAESEKKSKSLISEDVCFVLEEAKKPPRQSPYLALL